MRREKGGAYTRLQKKTGAAEERRCMYALCVLQKKTGATILEQKRGASAAPNELHE